MLKNLLLTAVAITAFSAHRPAEDKYEGWQGSRPPGWAWGVTELWWYGKAKVFSHDAEVVYRTDDATSFWVKGKVQKGKEKGLFGVSLEWFKPLEKGYL